jgi:hypothetical protein
MSQNQTGSSSPLSINNLQDGAENLLLFLASILGKTADMVVRPFFGTRYYPPAVDAFAFLFLLLIAGIHSAFFALTHVIPFVAAPPPPPGMFDLWWLVKISFLAQIFHRARLLRRMIDFSKERFSWYEGPALPFIQLIPGSKSFWRTRIFIEPALVFMTASVLQHVFIFQSSLATFIQVSAVALALKQALHWNMSWQVMRDAMDALHTAPLMSAFIDNRATEEELAPIHLASFPKDATPEVRRAAAIHVARSYGQSTLEGENNATDR